ncbi:hypothetical protein C348_00666 [Cryptococcus neoformans Gb118]|nr:hypothetical protein C350_00665 [Cryptococcus neoformans var. grubii MW-RSA36]OXL11148.1 hypothetical protein C348_00666 [Cryptococcus neoformans var. grubii Gb118]
MEFDNLETPRVTLATTTNLEANGSNPSPPIAPPPCQPIITKPKKKVVNKKRGKLTRYLPPLRTEAFIGPFLPSFQDTIMLIQKECPSLSVVPPSCISLQLRFDGNTQDAVKDVPFNVLPSAWPDAASEVLPLVYIQIKGQDTKVGRSTLTECDNGNKVPRGACEQVTWHPKLEERGTQTQADKHPELKPGAPIEGLTWDDLKKNGTLLGIQSAWHDDGAMGCNSTRALLD